MASAGASARNAPTPSICLAPRRPPVDGTAPYVAQEVIPGGTGQLAPASFEVTGSLLGFDYADDLTQQFNGSISNLKTFGTSWGLLPSSDELVFVENHDTERNGSTLSYKDGPTNTIATEFMLAEGYESQAKAIE